MRWCWCVNIINCVVMLKPFHRQVSTSKNLCFFPKRGTEFFLMDVCRVEKPAALRMIQLESLFQGFHLVSQSGDCCMETSWGLSMTGSTEPHTANQPVCLIVDFQASCPAQGCTRCWGTSHVFILKTAR